MPYTLKQTRYLLSSGSPLTPEQKSKIKNELKSPGMILPPVNALKLSAKKERKS